MLKRCLPKTDRANHHDQGQDDPFLEVATSMTNDKLVLAALSKVMILMFSQLHKSILTTIISLASWAPYISQAPFAWVSVKEDGSKRTTVTLEKLGARDASKYLTMRKRGTDRRGRQNTFSSPNKPLLKYAHIWFCHTCSDQVSLQEKLNIVFF